jgi:hypothetical protein
MNPERIEISVKSLIDKSAVQKRPGRPMFMGRPVAGSRSIHWLIEAGLPQGMEFSITSSEYRD